MNALSAAEARAFFPRGLLQPQGSFRFSLDALLLASFLKPGQGGRLLDLGTGCGVVALAMLCRYPEVEAVGVDVQPELAMAARVNAERLGLGRRFTVLCRDLTALEPPLQGAGTFSLVLANPPYRQRRCGRLPASPLRLTALFEQDGGLSAFCRAAEAALTPEGRFGVIFPADRRDYLFSSLTDAGLYPLRLLPVQAREKDSPMLLLVEAAKTPLLQGPMAGQGSGPYSNAATLRYDPPLILYHGQGELSSLTEEALAFCPFLTCNTAPEKRGMSSG